MRSAWALWLVVTVLVAAYCGMAKLASSSWPTPIILAPGQTATVSVFRLVEPSDLRMELLMNEWVTRHTNHRSFGTAERLNADLQVIAKDSPERAEYLRYSPPDATIRLTIEMPGGAPVTYDTVPNSRPTRSLSPQLFVEPGLIRLLPENDRPPIRLHRGWTAIRVTVLAAEPPLLGTHATLIAAPLLGLKATDPRVLWLAWGLFWPLFVLPLIAWFVIQFGYTVWRWARGY